MRTQSGVLRSSPFFEVYYFADLAVDVLRDPVASGCEWSDFISDLAEQAWDESYPKTTTMHRFLQEMVSRSFCDRDFATISAPDLPAYVAFQRDAVPFEFQRLNLRVERALSIYGLASKAFEGWPDASGSRDEGAFFDWYEELKLTDEYGKLVDRIADEVFTILFANRDALFTLNDWLAAKITAARQGNVQRRQPPTWARRAVFYRDRGRCCICGTDLSGLLSLNMRPTFDHIVPLVAAGPNDLTNLQLLCAECNQKKGGGYLRPTFTYEPWFEPDCRE